MINGGLATLFVSDLAQAVDFYTRILGLELTLHVEGKWAQVDAGPGSESNQPTMTRWKVVALMGVVARLSSVSSPLCLRTPEDESAVVEDIGRPHTCPN